MLLFPFKKLRFRKGSVFSYPWEKSEWLGGEGMQPRM